MVYQVTVSIIDFAVYQVVLVLVKNLHRSLLACQDRICKRIRKTVCVLYCFRDFTQFFNPIHGTCYAYNSGWDSDVKLKTSTKSGRRHGKSIYAFVPRTHFPDLVLK